MRALLVCLCAVLAVSTVVRYDNHQVWRVTPENVEQVERLHKLYEISHGPMDYDFWLSPSAPMRAVDIRVSPAAMDLVKEVITGMKWAVHISNLQEYFDNARLPAGTNWDQSYHNYPDIVSWMQGLANQYSYVSMINVGLSYQNQTIWGVKISQAPSNAPQIWLDGGIHAREWMAPAVVQYIIEQLSMNATLYSNLLTTWQWYLIPVFNPDGYVYSFTTDPNWRKNRQPTKGSPCIGTDLCRNFAAGWGGPGSSNNPCDDTYHGPAVWSGPEAVVVRNYLQTLTLLKAYVNFHSYAESWLDPYGYTPNLPAAYQEQQSNAKNCTTTIKSVNGAVYTYGPAYTTIYPASGIPSDWVYDTLGVHLSQAVELRGGSFQPPPSNIMPIATEIFAGVQTLVYDAINNP